MFLSSMLFFFLMIRRPPRSTLSSSSAASDVYKRQVSTQSTGGIVQAMKFLSLLPLWCILGTQALPFDDQVAGTPNSTGFPCFSKYCRKPSMKYERILNVKPRIQWDDAGGYCGSMAIQNVALGKGVWISQQQVRDHTVPGGGHDEEILETNVAQALTNLKLKFEGFDYQHQPVPQADAYRAWIKQHLAAGNGIAWMIMLAGGPDLLTIQPRLTYYSSLALFMC
eukprot:TRINITY_DN8292_c0_g1_i4.p1 TRINITY_DN8292_c0_g1~~TRINITY_DN8292_c0_g1_i4.p1  ORF type:complete len:224 (+),score=50.38 TRINITY_DN8292_c0_g1_i4:48-719(+)